MRDQLFDAAIDVVNQGPEERHVDFLKDCGGTGLCIHDTEISWVTSNAVVIERFDGDGDVHGVLSLKMTNPQHSSYGCSKVLGLLGDAAGAISGIGGGIFGAVSSFCDDD